MNIEEELNKISMKTLEEFIQDGALGYSIIGGNPFYNKAFKMYYKEVITFKELCKLPKEDKPKAAKESEKWILLNQSRILAELYSEAKDKKEGDDGYFVLDWDRIVHAIDILIANSPQKVDK